MAGRREGRRRSGCGTRPRRPRRRSPRPGGSPPWPAAAGPRRRRSRRRAAPPGRWPARGGARFCSTPRCVDRRRRVLEAEGGVDDPADERPAAPPRTAGRRRRATTGGDADATDERRSFSIDLHHVGVRPSTRRSPRLGTLPVVVLGHPAAHHVADRLADVDGVVADALVVPTDEGELHRGLDVEATGPAASRAPARCSRGGGRRGRRPCASRAAAFASSASA